MNQKQKYYVTHGNIEEGDINKYALNSSESDEIASFHSENESKDSFPELRGSLIISGNDITPDFKEHKKPKLPDGGWGWVIVLSSFLVSVCIDGLGFSFGLLREEMAKQFKTTQTKTSLIGSLFIALPLITGPIMSLLVDRYGCRFMTIIAGILSTVGFLLSSLTTSVPLQCLTFGLMGGLSLGILYVTSVVSVTLWFDMKRNLALSIALSGFGIGPIVYSTMINYLLRNFDFAYAMIILAGTLLNTCVCGALMRIPDWLEPKRTNFVPKNASTQSLSGSIPLRFNSTETILDSESEVNVSNEVSEVRNLDPGILPLEIISEEHNTNPKRTSQNKEEANKEDQKHPVKQKKRAYWCTEILSDHNYLNGTPLHKNRIVYRGAMTSIPKYKLQRNEHLDIYKNSNWSLSSIDSDYLDCLFQPWMTPDTTSYYSTLHNTRFVIFNVCTLNVYAWSIIPYFFLNSFISEAMSEGAVDMICVIGIGSIIGMIIFSWLANQNSINIITIYAACLITSGVMVIVYPFCISNYGILVVISFIFGITFASSYSFTPGIIMDMIPLDKFTTAYGTVLLIQGLGHFIGPLIGGMLYDHTHSWCATFYLAGVGLIASGLGAGFIAFAEHSCLEKFRKKKGGNSNDTNGA